MARGKNYIPWIVGSLVLFTAGVMIVPSLITRISSVAYKVSNKNLDDELFPEPVIEKKSGTREEIDEDGGI